MWEKNTRTTECDKSAVKCDVSTAQCDNGTIKCEKKNKETIECDKNTVTYDVSTIQIPIWSWNCQMWLKIKVPLNVIKVWSNKMLVLPNVTFEPSNVREKKKGNHRMWQNYSHMWY